MRKIASLAKRALRPLAVAIVIGLGALSASGPASAGGWHGGGGGWHGGGGGYYWHGGGWHGGWGGWHGGGCCWGGGPYYSFSFGFPFYYPYAYPYAYPYPAYSYYPPAYGYGYGAPSYSAPMNTAQAPAGPPPQQNWYYCENPHGYYPYVQSCSSGWHAVPVQPPETHTTN